MLKLVIIISIISFFAYSLGKRYGEQKSIGKKKKNIEDESDIIDAEIVERDD